MKYRSKIEVERNPKEKKVVVEKCVGWGEAYLTIDFLKSLGKEDDYEFWLHPEEGSGKMIISYDSTRLETEEEVAKRVAKEEDYNRRYEEYHKNNKQ